MKFCSVCHSCYDDEELCCNSDDHPLLIPSRIGRCDEIRGYLIENLLSLDTRSELYRARHLASGRSCLIKFIGSNSALAEQFLRDAETATTLIRANIADVYEAGRTSTDHVYIVSEDASGQTLRDILDGGTRPDLLRTIQIMSQAAEAVHALHLTGLYHLAIKPENILIANDNAGRTITRIQHIDLGGLVYRSIVSDKFTIDSAKYELRYFAPELFSNEAVSIKADIYALGVVLFELLTGHPPFDSASAAGIIERHRTEAPPEIVVDDFDLRMLVTHTLMESLNKHPQNRQSSANAFARQLRHIDQLATHVSTPPPATSAPPWPQPAPAIMQPVAISKRHIAHLVAAGESAVTDVDIETSFPTTTDPIQSATVTDLLPAVSAHSIEAAAARASFPPASSLTRFRRRTKRRHPKPVSISSAGLPPQKVETFDEKPPNLPAKRVEWSQPEDDIPSMDAVAAVLAESSQVTPALTNLASVTSATAKEQIRSSGFDVNSRSNPIKLEQPKSIEPKQAEVTASTSGVGPESRVLPRQADKRSALKAVPNPRIRKQTKTSINEPLPNKPATSVRRAAPAQLVFVPTLLGSARENLEVEHDPVVFKSYQPPKRLNPAGRNQKMIMVAGILVAASIFLFSTDSVWRQSRSLASSEQPSSETPVVKQQSVPPVVAAPAAEEKKRSSVTSDNLRITTNETEIPPPNRVAKKETAPPVKPKDHPAEAMVPSQKPSAVKTVANEALFKTQRIEIPQRGGAKPSISEVKKPAAPGRARVVSTP